MGLCSGVVRRGIRLQSGGVRTKHEACRRLRLARGDVLSWLDRLAARIFARHGLDVEMVLMQGASTYMPARASGTIQVLYGGGTAVSRAIGTGGFDLAVIATENDYGFHERFNPQGIKNRVARPYLDSSFVQRAVERLKLGRR